MAVGKQQLTIDAEQLVRGMATSLYTQDGALSPECISTNPFATKGVIRPMGGVADKSTNATSEMIASAEDSQSILADNRWLVDDEGGYYSCASDGTLTKELTGAQTSKYTFGFTDMVTFALQTYVTLTDDVALVNTSGTPSLDEDWWSVTKGQGALETGTPHPMLVFEGLLWIADKNVLHNVDSLWTVTPDALTLASNERIQALGIDPGTGLMLLSVQTTQNYSDTLSTKNFIYLYDGYSNKPRRKIVVDGLVTAFYNVGGTVYVGFDRKVGAFNGSGITFLRAMQNISFLGSQLLYKHHFGNIGNILLVVDGKDLLAYGEVVAGQKGWFNVLQNPASSQAITCVAPLGSDNFGIAFAPNKWYFANLTSEAGTSMSMFTNNINFPRPVFIRSVRVITTGIATTGSSGIGSVAVLDNNGGTNQPPGANGTFLNLTGSTRYTFDFQFGGLKLESMRLRINTDTQAFGIVRIIVFYDVAE